MCLGRVAFFAVDLVVELLRFVELCKTVIQGRIISLIHDFIGFFTSWSVLHDLVCNIVVAFRQYLGVPFDGEEARSYHVLIKDWCISGLEDTSTAPAEPVALRANIASSIDSLQDEGRIDTFTILNDFTPIFLLPPPDIWSMEATIGFKEDMGTGPHFLIHSASTRSLWHLEDQRIGNDGRDILCEDVVCLFYESSMVCNNKDILWHFEFCLEGIVVDIATHNVENQSVFVDFGKRHSNSTNLAHLRGRHFTLAPTLRFAGDRSLLWIL